MTFRQIATVCYPLRTNSQGVWADMAEIKVRKRIHITGVVQGVGFRPFVYQLATERGLAGWVLNSSSGVDIEVEGPPEDVEAFIGEIPAKTPPLARLESLEELEIPPNGDISFTIKKSLEEEGFILVSPDIATCDECVSELFDPSDRRHRYPFINCTNCGPRFTIIEDIPYDRPKTTMKKFPMCPDCRGEYEDPMNRRFHAQPNACPVCGPKLELRIKSDDGAFITEDADDPIKETIRLLSEGKIAAIKGLGGFHLACDAKNEEAVAELRRRKHRYGKPLAIMVADVEEAKKLCEVSDDEAKILESPQRPIVLLKAKGGIDIAPSVAPGVSTLGVMLPYTPLHHLLLKESGLALVMTSGNLSEEPIAMENEEAMRRLAGIADAFLLNDRDIYSRYDDSVVRDFRGELAFIRRARGFAPYPIKLPFEIKQVLAVGPEQKNTFCLTKENYAFVSQHIGDLENLETLEHFENTLELYERLFRIKPELAACDLHPEYLSTKFAKELPLPLVEVQHHHAHAASCLAENGILSEAIGVSFDGTGYGLDGAIWGGEFLLCNLYGFERVAHLDYVRMPGGAEAIKKPYRMAIAHLYDAFGKELIDLPVPMVHRVPEEELKAMILQLERGINSPLTSSAGRLFDAVAALVGVRDVALYEGQAAVELEAIAEPVWATYPFEVVEDGNGFTVKIAPLIRAIVADIEAGIPAAIISQKFHRAIAEIVVEVCGLIRDDYGNNTVALSGGVFQNWILFGAVVDLLEAAKFHVVYHRLVPANDGGISLGQAVVAGYKGD